MNTVHKNKKMSGTATQSKLVDRDRQLAPTGNAIAFA